MTFASPVLAQLRAFFFQGFHLFSNPIQTVLTAALLLVVTYLVVAFIVFLVKRIKAAVIMIKDDAGITKTQWFEHQRLVGEINDKATKAAGAVTTANAAKIE